MLDKFSANEAKSLSSKKPSIEDEMLYIYRRIQERAKNGKRRVDIILDTVAVKEVMQRLRAQGYKVHKWLYLSPNVIVIKW